MKAILKEKEELWKTKEAKLNNKLKAYKERYKKKVKDYVDYIE